MKLPDFGWDLPPGVTQSMCDANIIDEDTPCGTCGHRLDEHENDKKCLNKYDDCECQEWTEGEYEPPEDDWRDD